MDNYRTVSNLPFGGKVLECIVALQLQGFLDVTDYLDPFQHTFRPEFRMETAPGRLDDLRRDLDRGGASLLILLDLSAAFDPTNPGILLKYLSELELSDTVLHCFHSFLSDSTQKAVLGDFCSSSWLIAYGIPQGLVSVSHAF